MLDDQLGAAIGVVPVLPAPFHPDQSLDVGALEPLIDFAASAGVKAACLPAYGTEFYKLSEAERFALVDAAVKSARGRLTIVGQSNHPSPALAAEIARRNEGLGAGIISFALPRQFSYSEEVLLRYAAQVANAVRVPVLVQDLNPGGPSVGLWFAQRLKEAAPNFCFVKLEEPSMGPKIRAIRAGVAGVGVVAGWGGMYLLELASDGLAGVMPGTAMCDLFVILFQKMQAGDLAGAAAIHSAILPQILVSLQSLEMFHHCEKRLLAARGLLRCIQVRDPAIEVDENLIAHIELVNRLVLAEVSRNGLTSTA
jgi:4-hydroxy-tetrahydrodipicolinate synthase